LQSLDLSCHVMGTADGATTLAAALPSLTGLRSLHLSCKSMGAQGTAALAAALLALTGLRSLDLSGNGMGAAGAAALAAALQALTAVQSLNLGSECRNSTRRGKRGHGPSGPDWAASA
jgi:Ran GTPase-activating protein (RanGAP) involved in mRNA processing and transport